MKRWNSQVMKAFVEDNVPEVEKVMITSPGGDVDTETLVIKVKDNHDNRLYLRGFITGEDDEFAEGSRGDCDIEMLELRDGMSCEEGLVSTDLTFGIAYLRLKNALKKEGWAIHHYLKDYF